MSCLIAPTERQAATTHVRTALRPRHVDGDATPVAGYGGCRDGLCGCPAFVGSHRRCTSCGHAYEAHVAS